MTVTITRPPGLLAPVGMRLRFPAHSVRPELVGKTATVVSGPHSMFPGTVLVETGDGDHYRIDALKAAVWKEHTP